jgi:hypothetical protein
MPTLQIREVPQEIYDKLKIISLESRRSMTQQVIHYIEKGIDEETSQALRKQRKLAALKRIKEMKQEFSFDTSQVVDWIREDRDR